MLIFSLIFFLMVFATLSYLGFTAYRFITKGPDFVQLEISGTAGDLIRTLVDEIHTALSLNQTEVIHRFNPNEPPIDGEVAASVTFIVAQTTPCVIIFNSEPNHDVKITLQRMNQPID